VDVERCRRFLRHVDRLCGGRPCQRVFHRAFDVAAEPRVALEQLIDLGFTRVLTSGRAAQAMDGLEELRRTVEQADGRIEVLPGGGLRPEDLPELVRRTGVSQVHLSAASPAGDSSATGNPEIRFGADLPASEAEYRATDSTQVRRARAALDALR